MSSHTIVMHQKRYALDKGAKTMNRQATNSNGQHRELTLQQQTAVELLAQGKTDKEVGETLNLPRTRVAKWRLYDPVFQAALNAYRTEIWAAALDRLRTLIPKALDTLAEGLNRADNPDRCKIALDILRLAKLSDIAPQGSTDPETIVRRAVNQERQQARGPLDDLAENHKGLPGYQEHLARKWAELESRVADEQQHGSPGS